MAVGDEILTNVRLVPTVTSPMVALNQQKASSATLPQLEYRTYVADSPTYLYLVFLGVFAANYDDGNLTVEGECKFDTAIAGTARIEAGFALVDIGTDPLLAATVSYEHVDLTPPDPAGQLVAWSIPFSNAQAGVKKKRQAYMSLRRQRDDVNDDALGGVLIPAGSVLVRQAA